MAVFVKAFCLLAAFCITIEAQNDTSADPTKKPSPPATPPQNFDFVSSIYNQTTPSPGTITRMTRPSIGNQATIRPNIVGGSTSIDDDSSEEDYDTDTNDEGEAQSVPSYAFMGSRNRVSGNTRPLFPGKTRQGVMTGVQAGDLEGDYDGDFFGVHDHLVGRTAGTSARGVGIALGVLGLLTVVIAAAFVIIRKQRNDTVSFVRI